MITKNRPSLYFLSKKTDIAQVRCTELRNLYQIEYQAVRTAFDCAFYIALRMKKSDTFNRQNPQFGTFFDI